MRKVTKQVGKAFINGHKKTVGNTHTDGKALYLHGNLIAEKVSDGIRITNAGWKSVTTKERLNGLLELLGVTLRIYQKNFVWYLWNYGCQTDMEYIDGMVISK